jgi:hypothetical protein
LNQDFYRLIQRVTGPRITRARLNPGQQREEGSEKQRLHSAAATNDGFTFADDIMKSEMRGTISDLKREPLKTP